jgi:hypothetical protein
MLREWGPVLRFVHDNITLLVSLAVAGIMASAWIVFEAMRSHSRRDQIFALRRKVAELERSRSSFDPSSGDPVVLPSRWVRVGSAATTSDGGCWLYLERVSMATRSASLSLRIDGMAALEGQAIRAGERLEAGGKNGTYVVELYGVEGTRAHVAVGLRSRHRG